MRRLLLSAVGVASATALALPPALPAAGATQPPGAGGPGGPAAPAGSTRTLALTPILGTDRVLGARAVRGLPARTVAPFSLLGVTWDDAGQELHGTVQVRTRAAGTGIWSEWQDVQTHNDDLPDVSDTADRVPGRTRGTTVPLWVGDSDGVQVRVRPEPVTRARPSAPPLPGGLRLDMVDPGDEPEVTDRRGGSARSASLPQAGVLPAESAAQTRAKAPATPFIGPRPRIVTRAGWGADEKLRKGKYVYTKTVKAAFVHHSGTGNNYTCAKAPSVIRSIYRYHVKSSGWRDIGYNFLVDKCGNIYEGRGGGITKAVMGAHTLGFNTNSMGIAVLGTYSRTNPPAAALQAVSKLTAWKLGLFGGNPDGSTTMVSGGSNKYKKGKKVKLRVISGHRDGFVTECPGARLYKRLGVVRDDAAGLQGR